MSDTLKRRWRLDNNFLVGITAGKWWRLLRENGFAVDPAYWYRAAAITVISLFNTVRARREERVYDKAVEKTAIPDPPLFILGHWRTGTTHLQNLLSRDPQFAFPNLYQIIHSSCFLSTEEANARRFASRLPRRRPMDDVAMDPSLPGEDEFAVALTCFRSPYLAMSFPRHRHRYGRYLTFQGVPAEEVEEWKRALRWFVKKLTLKYRRPLVLKSPPHTARIRLLLDLFPEARFVHIHRDPYAVFSSWQHNHHTTSWYMCLQKPTFDQTDDEILKGGQVIFDAFLAERHLIPPGRLVDVSYENLKDRPMEVVRGIYDGLGLPGFEAFRPRLQAYLDSLAGYRTNRFPELTPPLRQKVATAWCRAFQEWGYPV